MLVVQPSWLLPVIALLDSGSEWRDWVEATVAQTTGPGCIAGI